MLKAKPLVVLSEADLLILAPSLVVFKVATVLTNVNTATVRLALKTTFSQMRKTYYNTIM